MNEKRKIGGWLYVFAVFLPILLLVHLYYSVSSVLVYWGKDFMEIQNNYGTDYTTMIQRTGLFLIVSSIFVFIGMLLVNFTFFKKKKVFIRYFIIVYTFSLIFSYISNYLAAQITGNLINYTTSLRLTLIVLISVTYLLRSKRVKETFNTNT